MKKARSDFKIDLENQKVYIPSIDTYVDFGDITIAYERARSALVNSQKKIKGSAYYVPKEPVPQDFKDIYPKVEKKLISITNRAKELGISRATFYRYKDKYIEELKEAQDNK